MINRIEQIQELSSLPIAFWIYSRPNKSFQYISPKIKNLFEHNIEKITDIKQFRAIIHPEDQSKVLRNLNGGLSATIDNLEYRIITAKGKIKWLKNTAITIPLKSKEHQHVIGTTYALPFNKSRNEAEQIINPIDLIKCFEGTHLILNKQGHMIYSHVQLNERSIFKKESSSKQLNIFKNLKATVAKQLFPLFSNALLNNYSSTHSISQKTGKKIRHFKVQIKKLNQFLLLVSIEKEKESLLKKYSLEKFYTISDQSPQLVVITDLAGRIEYVNPMFTKTTGYTLSEVKGKEMNIVRPIKYRTELYKNLWSTILKGKAYKNEFHNIKKNGTYYIEQKIISPIRDEGGQITNFVSFGTDVTKERRLERKKQKT